MSRKANDFKVGLFIIAGFLLTAFVVVVLGAGRIFTKTVAMETYVNESVNGLDVGSAVKFMGVKIGSVAHIGFISDYYHDFDSNASYPYVLVRCELNKSFFYKLDEGHIAEHLKDQVLHGLRVRPTSQGLTGQIFLNLAYLPPEANPPLPINWDPEVLYIPAAPSTLSRVEKAISSISATLENVKHVDIAGVVKDLKEVAGSVVTFLDKTNAEAIGDELAKTLHQTTLLVSRINELLATPRADAIIPDVADIVEHLKQIVEAVQGNLVAMVDNMRATGANTRAISKRIDDFLSGPEGNRTLTRVAMVMDNVANASIRVRTAADKADMLMGRLNDVVAGQQLNIQSILDDVRLLLQNLRELSDEAKRYPAGVLFGNPPGKAIPDEKK